MKYIPLIGEGKIITSNGSRNRSSTILHKISMQLHHCIYNHLRYHKMTNLNKKSTTSRVTTVLAATTVSATSSTSVTEHLYKCHISLSATTFDTLLPSPSISSLYNSSSLSTSSSPEAADSIYTTATSSTNNSNSVLSMKQQHHQQRNVYDDMISNAIERLTVMCRQDNEIYSIHTQYMGTVPPLHISSSSFEHNNKKLINIVDCRTKIVSWCYEVIHFCNMHTETVELAMSIIDRYMFGDMTSSSTSLSSTNNNHCVIDAWNDKKIYQLIAMTSLYISIKVQEPEAFSIEMISNQLSRNTYSEEQIEDAEQHILYDIIQWKVNTPTITPYIHEYMDLLRPLLLQYQSTHVISNMIDNHSDNDDEYASNDNTNDDHSDDNQCNKKENKNKNMQHMLFHYLINQQIQIATIDFNMIKMKSYIKAYCIILNTLEILNVETHILASVDTILRKALYQCNPHLQRSSQQSSTTPFTTRSNITINATSVATANDKVAATTTATTASAAATATNTNDDPYYFSSSITHEIRGFLYYQVIPDYQYYLSSLSLLSPSISSTSLSSSAYLDDHNDTSVATTSSSSSSSWIQQEHHDKYEVKVDTSSISSHVILPHRVVDDDEDYEEHHIHILMNNEEKEEIMIDDSMNRNDGCIQFCCNLDSTTVPRKVSPTTVTAL